MKHKKVLQHIQDYGYLVTPTGLEDLISYHCFNPSSNNTFILIVLDSMLFIPKNAEILIFARYKSNLPLVYLLQVDGNMEDVVDFAQTAYNHNKPCLIYDPDDEVEFFLKDLWNTIVNLTRD
ncbi:MAG: hypothetical protein CVU95_07345 [Firmicutes bacterium HGW-Firmicutes-2]|jgi:hypothetical protein|nr:MAG: hypothetical protein CVU95_07345 [Firmicutes bacterium HGW-Firmicutes-2]